MLDAAVKIMETLTHDPGVFGAKGGKKPLVRSCPQPNMSERSQLGLCGDVEDLPFGFFWKMTQSLAKEAGECLIGGTRMDVAKWSENRMVLFENTKSVEPNWGVF